MHFGVSTRAVEIQHADPEYCPDGNGAAYPTLDDRLRYFLAHCTAADQARRLSLEQMLATAEAGAERPAEAYGRNARLESDAAVERVLARLLYNADVPMPMSPASPETKKRSFSDDELDDGQTKTKKRKESWNDPLTNIL
jgi:hypothetical protein